MNHTVAWKAPNTEPQTNPILNEPYGCLKRLEVVSALCNLSMNREECTVGGLGIQEFLAEGFVGLGGQESGKFEAVDLAPG